MQLTKTVSLVVALLAPLGARAATTPKVVKVVVYPDRALVTREAKVACGAGVKLELTELPPSADQASFRAFTDRGTIDGLRTESRARQEAFAARTRELDSKIEALRDQLRELGDATSREASVDELAQSFASASRTLIGRELLDGATNAKAWQSALDQNVALRLKAIAERAKLAEDDRKLSRQLHELTVQRGFLGAQSQQREYVAEVLVSCPAGESARVTLTYMVGGAGWTPAYEARAAADDASFELSTYATVTQTTGEDWRDAQLVLSTALPRQNATPPELSQLNVYGDAQKPPKKVLVSREGYRAHAEIEDADDGKASGSGRFANQPVGGKRPTMRDQGLSVQIEVPDSATVLGDATPARVLVGQTTMKSRLRLRTAPRLLPHVFRVVEASNAAPYPLLPGPIDVYRRGSFLARYDLERVAKGARFSLTFGIEDRVLVKRQTIAELKRDQGVLGPTRRRRFHYQIEIASYLPKAEEIEITEQVPVSELDDVKVGLDGTSAGYEHDKVDGMVKWKPKLGGGLKQKVDLMFYIDVPASYDTSGD